MSANDYYKAGGRPEQQGGYYPPQGAIHILLKPDYTGSWRMNKVWLPSPRNPSEIPPLLVFFHVGTSAEFWSVL